MQIGISDHAQRMRASLDQKKESKKLVDSIYHAFATMQSKILLYRAMYFGHQAVGALFNSSSKVISAPAMPIIDELTSYIKGRMRMPSVTPQNEAVESNLVEKINNLICTIYNKNRIEDALLYSWRDFMICGVGIVKVSQEVESVIHGRPISPVHCIWDTSDSKYPQFFIHEETLSNDVASIRYGIDQEKFAAYFSSPSIPKVVLNENKWADELSETYMPQEGKPLSSKSLNSIYDDNFTKNMVYEKPSIGRSCIRHEYRRSYTKAGSELLEGYNYKLFLNDKLVKSETIPKAQFPYIMLCNKDESSNTYPTMYPCFLDRVKDDILAYNILKNTQLDTCVSASSISGLVVMDQDAVVDGTNKDSNNSMRLNTLKVKTDTDKGINDVVTKVPPVDLGATVSLALDNCLKRIRLASGLMFFEESKAKSGYHESLRLDREFSNISTWMTQLDHAIITIGERMVAILGQYLKKDITFLKKFSTDFESLNEDTEKLSILLADGVSIEVVESQSSDSAKQKVLTDLRVLSELTGDAFPIQPTLIARIMGMSKDTIDILAENNIVNPMESQAANIELQKQTASAQKDMAMAEKYKAEAKQIKKGEK